MGRIVVGEIEERGFSVYCGRCGFGGRRRCVLVRLGGAA